VGSYDLCVRAKPNRHYMVVGHSYTEVMDSTFPTFIKVATDLGMLDPFKVKKSKPPSCILRNGAEVRFRSADDPERLRGGDLTGVWMDEASLQPRDAFDIAIACLREGGEQGWLSATMTPKGMGHWTYSVFGTNTQDNELFHSTTKDNPFIVADYYERLTRQLGTGTGIARQELAGEFLPESDDIWQCIPTAWVIAAQERWKQGKPADAKLTCIGVDPAHGGEDLTVIARRYGSYFAPLIEVPGSQTPDGQSVATLVIQNHEDDGQVNIDAIGYGASAFDILKEQRWLTVKAVNNSEQRIIKNLRDKTRRFKFKNVRAASYWKFREALDPIHGDHIALPDDPQILADLTAARYKVTEGGIQLEAKEDIKERLSRSPDRADAIVLAYWKPTWPIKGIRTLTIRVAGKRIGRDIYCSGAEDIPYEIDPFNTLILCIHSTPSTDNLDQTENPIARIHLHIPDLDPKDYRDRWNEPLPEFDGKTIIEAIITTDTAKSFNQAITQDYSRHWQHLFIIDDQSGRLSKTCAVAAADILSIPRDRVWFPGRDDEVGKPKLEPPNQAVYEALKAARSWRCG
jgi:hypothetical protein